jgi:hypothetical protein
LLAAMIGAVKVSQHHAWVYTLRRKPRAAIVGAVIVGVAAATTLPITGLPIWFDWLAQLRRATDPTWELGGIAIARLLDPVLGLAIALGASILVFLWAPRRHAGAWVGLISVIGASSLHTFGLLFLVPAMLVVRRELALIAMMLIGTTTYEGTWTAIGLVGAGMVWATVRPAGPRSLWAAPRQPAVDVSRDG